MRLRSIHPKYLDRQWLLAVRREWLLAKKVLAGKTKWYTQHPQLERFRLDHQKNESAHRGRWNEVFLDARAIPTAWETVSTNKVKWLQVSKAVVDKEQKTPTKYIDAYLSYIYQESQVRWYVFDQSKINCTKITSKIIITEGQIAYEYQRLQSKLQTRTPDQHKQNKKEQSIQLHPLFKKISWGIASREKI